MLSWKERVCLEIKTCVLWHMGRCVSSAETRPQHEYIKLLTARSRKAPNVDISASPRHSCRWCRSYFHSVVNLIDTAVPNPYPESWLNHFFKAPQSQDIWNHEAGMYSTQLVHAKKRDIQWNNSIIQIGKYSSMNKLKKTVGKIPPSWPPTSPLQCW